jgi:hypothetical protein
MKILSDIKNKILSAAKPRGFSITNHDWLRGGPRPVKYLPPPAPPRRQQGWLGVRPGSWWNRSRF